jgi:hypothetical protein
MKPLISVVLVLASFAFSITGLIVGTHERKQCGIEEDCLIRAGMKQLFSYFLLCISVVFGMLIPGVNRVIVKNEARY